MDNISWGTQFYVTYHIVLQSPMFDWIHVINSLKVKAYLKEGREMREIVYTYDKSMTKKAEKKPNNKTKK